MHQSGEQRRQTGLPLVADGTTRAIIVGTFPGAASLRLGQYYADARNHFWRILSILHQDDYLSAHYSPRIMRLLAQRIGLWDVFESCIRSGGADKTIREPRTGDLKQLRDMAPSLELICFNGRRAATELPRFAAAGYSTTVLPSSSSALAVSIETKAKAWQLLIPRYIPPLTLATPLKPLKPITQEMIREGIEFGRE